MGLFAVLFLSFSMKLHQRFLQAENIEGKPFPIGISKMNPRKYGKGGEFASNRLDDQELSMLALHLLQISLVYVNTLMVQEVLAEGEWTARLTKEDYRGLTPLFYSHVNPYGILRLDMTERLPIRQEAAS